MDPFVALTAAAAVTSRILVGTGVCLVIQRDPIVLANEVASLDHISGGRFMFGVGGGWNREEMRNHGTDPRRRWDLLRERVEAMQAIWTQDEPEYHGSLVDFDRIWSWPKPVQKPHPPILVGGDGAGTFDRVLGYGDAWMPIVSRARTVPFEDRVAELQKRAQQQGRPPVPITVWHAGPATAEVLDPYRRLGVERVVLWLPPAGAEEVLPRLDRYAELGSRFG
jgi:probable F420-dependent oxidoreductase